MADSKITVLTAITTVDPAVDVLPIVDVSDTTMAASGTTKKITSNQILGAGGTATLASATITGDLTVDTSTLKVDSANNRVGIGTTSLFGGLNIQTGSNCRLEIYSQSNGITIENLNNARNAYLNMTMYADAYIWNRLGTTAMTLNSTGLGVGVTPSAGRGAIQLSAGVGFPATQVASSDANTLDDYEEGTFTPIMLGTVDAGTGTYGSQVGRYTKIGNLVTVSVYLDWTAHTATGSMRLGGLPFATNATANTISSVAFGYINTVSLTASNVLTGFTSAGNTFVDLYQTPTGGGVSTVVPVDTSAAIAYNVSYRV